MGSRLVLAACLLVPTVCYADLIRTVPIPPAFRLTGFGSSEVYRGQTFTTPSGGAITADSLSVFVGGTFDSGAVFHVLIAEVDTSAGIHPTNVLFESGTLTAGISFNEFHRRPWRAAVAARARIRLDSGPLCSRQSGWPCEHEHRIGRVCGRCSV